MYIKPTFKSLVYGEISRFYSRESIKVTYNKSNLTKTDKR